ncbi:MAG TPA: methylenetetrahydrofolate reductase, partial [Verrucomicrobiota bacterium]|nr:methylenetetrahydrofolate reductase [Verrucomicrobiota bacterium]
AAFVPSPGGLRYAHELVSLARERGGFAIGVAGFPEGHMECREGKQADWGRLKAKIDCGADFVITQLFFENAWFYEFRDYLVDRLGVRVPIVPGVIPIVSGAQIRRILGLCGASLPEALRKELDALGDHDDAVAAFGIEHAAAQCRDLLRHGVPGIHFYTMNRAQPVMLILDRLGVSIRGRTPAGGAP